MVRFSPARGRATMAIVTDTTPSPTSPATSPVIHEGLPTQLPDIDPEETRDWIESFDAMIEGRGRDRARYLMLRLLERARQKQFGVPALRSTDYINTVPPEREPCLRSAERSGGHERVRTFRTLCAPNISKTNLSPPPDIITTK